MAQFAPPWSPQQTYTWTGTLNDPDEPYQKLSFVVLAGADGPTPTDGFSQISTIARARRLGFTYPIGFNPAAMDVPIRFDVLSGYGPFQWSAGDIAWTPGQLESNIQVLEWMGGRGKLYANGDIPAHGSPPIVQVSSFDAGGNATNLIPPNWRSESATDLRWLISAISYDSGAVRGPGGDRMLQTMTVSLIQYVATPGAPTSPRVRQQGRNTSDGFKTFTSTSAQDTIAKVCIAHGLNKASDWSTVMNLNLTNGNLKLRSYTTTLKIGTKVQVPDSLLSS